MKWRSIQNLITKVQSISMAVVPLSLLLFSGSLKAQSKVSNSFGLDADPWNDTFVVNSGITAPVKGSNDWFPKPYRWLPYDTGNFAIDTTKAYKIKADHVGGTYYRFQRGMAYPPYTEIDTFRYIWAAYLRDNVDNDSSVFAGGDKNGNDPETEWGVITQSVPDKNDLVDGGVFVMRSGLKTSSHLYMYGFSGIYAVNGDRNIDYELFRTEAYVSGGSFFNTGDDEGHSAWRFDNAGHVIRYGDILVSVEGSGTSVNLISLRIWMKKTTFDSMRAGSLPTPPGGFTLTASFEPSTSGLYGYAEINYSTSSSTQYFFGRTNSTLGSNTPAPPWGTFGKSGGTSGYRPNDYLPGQFMEFGLDLTYMGVDPYQFKTLDTGDWCNPSFGSIMIKSRSSSSFNSTLKDFIGPASFILPDINVLTANNGKMDCLKSSTSVWVTNKTGDNSNNWYEWVNTSSLNTTVDTGAYFNTTTPGTYRVYAMRGEGCRRVDSATIVVLKDVVKPVSYPWVTDTIMGGSVWTWDMTGDSSQYYTNLALASTVGTFGPSGGLSYLWNGISPWNDTITTTVANPGFLDTGWFELIVTEPRNGCKDTDEVKVFFLPVVWGDFNCAATGNSDVVLNWTTLSEDGAGVFEVQRFNANRFETIGAVSATGYSMTASHYQFVDQNPNPGRNFYRVKLIGLNGSTDYSEYCETMMGAGRGEIMTSVNLFPNPAGADVTVSVTGMPVDDAVITLMDQSGRIVSSTNMSNNIASLDITGLSSGIYLIKVEGTGISEVQKLIKK